MLAILPACYVSDFEIIADGEHAPITGRFSCENTLLGLGESEIHVISETISGGLFSRTYEYRDSQSPGELLKLSKLSDDLYLGQTRVSDAKASERDYKYQFLYFYITSADQFVVMVPNLMEHGPIIEAKATSHRVRLEAPNAEMTTFTKLRGSPADATAFLYDHSIASLMSGLDCSRS